MTAVKRESGREGPGARIGLERQKQMETGRHEESERGVCFREGWWEIR